MKSLVIRYGALGDGIIGSCVLPYLVRDGYSVTVNGSEGVLEVLKNNPNVSETIFHKRGSVPLPELPEYWDQMGKNYDKVVNLTSTMENDYLFAHPQPEYWRCLRWRRKRNEGVNYYDNQIKAAGYKPESPVLGQMFFSDLEKRRAKNFTKQFGKKKFVILWSLHGSGIQKVYLWYEIVARWLLESFSDIAIIASGSYEAKLLTFKHPRVVNIPQLEKEFRFAASLTKYANLVVGPETGLLCAAGCFTTPKICFLTQAGPEQITKYWINDHSMQADCYCSPCYLMHKYKGIWRTKCQVNELGWPKCTDSPGPGVLFDKIVEIYRQWKKKS